MKCSKKQIQEAIRHWENVLIQLNESKSPLLNALEKEFGKLTIVPYILDEKFQDYVDLSVYRMKKLEETEDVLMSLVSESRVVASNIEDGLCSIAF